MVNQMARENHKAQHENENFRSEMRWAIQNIHAQLAHITNAISKLEKKQGKLPAQSMPNANVNAITMRNEEASLEEQMPNEGEEVPIEIEE